MNLFLSFTKVFVTFYVFIWSCCRRTDREGGKQKQEVWCPGRVPGESSVEPAAG